MKKICILVSMAALIFVSATLQARDVLRLATTTSTDNTGLLDWLLPDFEKQNEIKVHVVAVGTGNALRLAKDGEADIVIVHAPALEKKFVEDGYGVKRVEFMYNDFVIVGPESDPAEVKEKSVIEALKLINKKKSPFVSRGDSSGTEIKEKSLWKLAGVTTFPDSYMEVGQGMGVALNIANERKAYTFSDRATYLALKDKIKLNILVEGDKSLYNQYSVIAVNPQKVKKVNSKMNEQFIKWLVSKAVQSKIAEFRKHGEQLFYPNAK